MSQKKDLNYFDKKGLIFSPPLSLVQQIPVSNVSQPQQHPFIKDLPKPNLLGGMIAQQRNSRSEIQGQDQVSNEHTQILAIKAIAYERELEQRQLQIQKLTSDYEKQRMQAFELEQKLVLLNEENMKYRETIHQGKKVAEKSQEQEIVHKQQMLQIENEQELQDRLTKSVLENQVLSQRLNQSEDKLEQQKLQIENLINQIDEFNRSQSLQTDEKFQSIYNNYEREKKFLKDEIEKINSEKREMFSEFQSKVRNLEIENASLRENASQAQTVQGNSVIQLKTQVNQLQDQIKYLEQSKSQIEQQSLQNQRNISQNHLLQSQEKEKLNIERTNLSEQLQITQANMRKMQQDIEDIQCERLGLLKDNEKLVQCYTEKTAAYENLANTYNESLKRNESNVEKILSKHEAEIQLLIENHKLETLQLSQRASDPNTDQRNTILEKIDQLQHTLLQANNQGISQDFLEQLQKTYQSLINMIEPKEDQSQHSDKQQDSFIQIQQIQINNQQTLEQNQNLILIIEERNKENARLQNICDSLSEEINELRQQLQVDEPAKRQKRISQSDNDTTQDINVSPSPLRPQIFEQEQSARNSEENMMNMGQLINDMRKQITDLEERLNIELENKNNIESENIKLRLSIQRYEMMGTSMQINPYPNAQNQNANSSQNLKDKSFSQQEDNSDMFEVSRYLQEEVSRLKGLLDGQKQDLDNSNLTSPHQRYLKTIDNHNIVNECIYEEQNEQSYTDSNQNTIRAQESMQDDYIKSQKQSRSKTNDEIRRSDIESFENNRLCFSFQDQIMHLNEQIRRAESSLRQYREKIDAQENLINEQNSIIEKNNAIIQQFQENLKESRHDIETSEHKQRELETSVLNYQTQLSTYVEQMHKNIEQLGQYESIIRVLESELQTKNTIISENYTVIDELNEQINQQQQQINHLNENKFIQSENDESEKVKRAQNHQRKLSDDNKINELSEQLQLLHQQINARNEDNSTLKQENQIQQQQNIELHNEIANLKVNFQQLLAAIAKTQNSQQEIHSLTNTELAKETYGEDILQELQQFIQNILIMNQEVQMMKYQFESLQNVNIALKQQYESLINMQHSSESNLQERLVEMETQNTQLAMQNNAYVQEIQKLTEDIDECERRITEDRGQIENLEDKATNLVNLEKVQSDIIDQQQKKNKQLQESYENSQKLVKQLQDKLKSELNNSLVRKNSEEQYMELQQHIQDLEEQLKKSELNRVQGEQLMSETSNLIDNLNNQINNYKIQIDKQQEIIMQEANKLENIQKEYHQKFISQKQAQELQNKLIHTLQSQIQTKELEISPLQTAIEQIQQILQSKTKELEKCQNLISNLQSQEKQSYEIIKQQEVFLLEFQKIKKQHQLEKEQNQKVIVSLQHSLDKAQKVNSELQNSLNEVKSRELTLNQLQERQSSENLQSSVKLDNNQSNNQLQNQSNEYQFEVNIDYKKQYEELKQILEDQNYLDTLNKYAQQEIQLIRDIDEVKDQNSKLKSDYDSSCLQISNLNSTIENLKQDFSFKNQRLQDIFESKIKEKSDSDVLVQQLKEQIKELCTKVDALENKTVLLVTENQRLSLIRMELTKQIDSKVANLSEQEGTYIKTLEKTLEETQKQRNELSEQVNSMKQQSKLVQKELENIQQERQQQNQSLERMKYQLNVNTNNLHQKLVYIEKLEQQINQLNNTNSQNLQQIHNSYHRKISEIRNTNTQINPNNNNLFSDDSKYQSFLNSISFQDNQELKKEKTTKEHQYNCLLVSYEDQKRNIETLSGQKDLLTQEIMLLKELNDQLVHQLNQNPQSQQGQTAEEGAQVQQQIAFINSNLERLQQANELLIKENEQLRQQCNLTNQKLANVIQLANQNKECICSCRGSNRLQVSVVEGEMEISDLKDYFGLINSSSNNENIALRPSHVNAKKYNLKINECTEQSQNSPNTRNQTSNDNSQQQTEQRKLEDIQNISINNSSFSEKKRTSSLMNPKDIRKSITDSQTKQFKLGESVDKLTSFNHTENQQI